MINSRRWLPWVIGPVVVCAAALAFFQFRPAVAPTRPPDETAVSEVRTPAPEPVPVPPGPAEQPAPAVPAVPSVPPSSVSVRVPILVYHSVMPHKPDQTPIQREYDVDPAVFDEQLKYLKDNGFSVVSLDALYRRLTLGQVLPEKSAVITFDDGWANQYEYALPVLKKYGDTATFFVFTDGVGSYKRMTWDQVRALAEAGMTIGSHTQTHRVMTSITDPAELSDELTGSKKILEEKLGMPVYFLAYPEGISNAAVRDAVKAAGYEAARSFQGGVLNDASRIFGLRSVMVTDDMAQFESYLTGEQKK